jgi:pilus assembly protein Flp/PilA
MRCQPVLAEQRQSERLVQPNLPVPSESSIQRRLSERLKTLTIVSEASRMRVTFVRRSVGPSIKEDGVVLYATMLLNRTKSYVTHFKKDEDGAALIEYTVLLAILVIAVLAIIGAVGTWLRGQWTALNTAL